MSVGLESVDLYTKLQNLNTKLFELCPVLENTSSDNSGAQDGEEKQSLGKDELHRRIVKRVSPFFEHAIDTNPNFVTCKWEDEPWLIKKNGKVIQDKTRTARIFKHCTSCNKLRFLDDYWSKIQEDHLAVREQNDFHTHMCEPCEKEFQRVVRILSSGLMKQYPKARDIFTQVHFQYLMGPLRSSG